MDFSEIGNLSEIITVIVAALTLVVSVLVQYETKKMQAQNIDRQKKLETIKAYNELQKNALSQLTGSKGYYQDIANKAKTDAGREKYKQIKCLAADCEHFSAGVELGLYDYDTVFALSGMFLYNTFENVKPIIVESRRAPGIDKASRYIYFENLAERISISNGIKQ